MSIKIFHTNVVDGTFQSLAEALLFCGIGRINLQLMHHFVQLSAKVDWKLNSIVTAMISRGVSQIYDGSCVSIIGWSISIKY